METDNVKLYLAPTEPHNKMCGLNFRLTDSLYDKTVPSRYAVEVQDGDDLYESIMLVDDDSNQVMLLRRTIGVEGTQSTFPYRLSEQTLGVDTVTNEPYDVWQHYLLDTQGNFHQEIHEGDRTIVALCGPYQQAHLTHFLKKSSPAPFLQYNQQADH